MIRRRQDKTIALLSTSNALLLCLSVQKRNLEILISDEKPPARSSSQSKGK